MTDTNFDPSDLQALAEGFDPDDVGESEDYSDRLVLKPGNYLSPSRDITKITKKDNGDVTVTLAFSPGVSPKDSGEVFKAGQFPLLSWVSTKTYSFDDRPGSTSSIAQYLRACGVETRGMSKGDMLAVLPETLTTPIYVYIGRTDRSKQDGNGGWTQKNLKTKDFNLGTKNDPRWADVVTIEGEIFEAKEKIQSYSEVR